MEDIREFDEQHGGQFYKGTKPSAIKSTLRTLEHRRLVKRSRHTTPQWSVTTRGESAITWLEQNLVSGR